MPVFYFVLISRSSVTLSTRVLSDSFFVDLLRRSGLDNGWVREIWCGQIGWKRSLYLFELNNIDLAIECSLKSNSVNLVVLCVLISIRAVISTN